MYLLKILLFRSFVIILTCYLIFQCTESKKMSIPGVMNAELVMDSATLQAGKIYQEYCSTCHGEQMLAFADRKWKHGKESENIYQSIKNGYVEAGMPRWDSLFNDSQIKMMANYILTGIENVERYGFQEITLDSDTFRTESLTFSLDTILSGIDVPWGMEFLPNDDLLVTERSGIFYRVDGEGNKNVITGTPTVRDRGQGGLLDVELHPDFAQNNWIYVSYSKMKIEKEDTLATTVVDRYVLVNDKLSDRKQLLEALPYTKGRNHFGGRLEFDNEGYLYISVGDRGKRTENPQFLNRKPGKIHRLHDDGRIPEDNPFVNTPDAVKSIYSYGHRNPQGMTLNPWTGLLWTHEHGPRGGDEINIIQKGLNYGWPTISYGINYDATVFTDKLAQDGMEQPLHYWVPSIAPSGMTFVDSNVYGDWKGDLLVGSLRFKYLNRCVIENEKVVREEILMKNIGRVRNVKVGNDGYIYVAVEYPGYIFRLVPINDIS